MKPVIIAIIIVILVVAIGALMVVPEKEIVSDIDEPIINNFEECIEAGNPAMESYPRQCRTSDGKHFVESIPEQEEVTPTSIITEQEEKIDVSQLTVQELKEQAVSWDYKDILRNEEYYKGKIIFLTGEIFSTEKGEDGWVEYNVRVNEDKFMYPDAEWFYVWHDGGRLLYEDTIEAYVMVNSIYEVKVVGWQYYPVVTAIHLTCTSC